MSIDKQSTGEWITQYITTEVPSVDGKRLRKALDALMKTALPGLFEASLPSGHIAMHDGPIVPRGMSLVGAIDLSGDEYPGFVVSAPALELNADTLTAIESDAVDIVAGSNQNITPQKAVAITHRVAIDGLIDASLNGESSGERVEKMAIRAMGTSLYGLYQSTPDLIAPWNAAAAGGLVIMPLNLCLGGKSQRSAVILVPIGSCMSDQMFDGVAA